MLTDLKCAPIDECTSPLKLSEVQKYLRETPGWNFQNGVITREFQLKNFTEAMIFVNQVAHVANSEDHHPTITISYNRVALKLTTHSIGGASINDFILAAKINQI